MQETVSSQDVVDQFTLAFELLIVWMEQRAGANHAKSVKSKPFRRMDENTILTAAEASKILGVSTPYIYQLMKQNKIPTIRVGRSVRIQKGDLDEMIKTQKSQQPD